MNSSFTIRIAALLFALLAGCVADSAPERAAVKVNYVISGEGQPVVLVHGFSQSLESWPEIPLYTDLKDRYRVISIDLRGHGKSDKPHEPSLYGQNMAQDLVAVLDQLNVDKAHFVGFSMGASVVGNLVITNPERVQTATLGSGFFTRWDDGEEDYARSIASRAGSTPEHWEPADQDYIALAASIRGMRFAQVTDEQIAEISTPGLVIFGTVETEHMHPAQRQLLETLPASIKLVEIEGADHDSHEAAILKPEFAKAVLQLIDQNPI